MMGLRFPSRCARDGAIAAAVCAATLTCLTSPALAAGGSTISVANDTSTPEQAVPVDLTISGTNASASAAEVVAVVRPAGGLACQASYQEDVSTLGVEDTTILAPGTGNAPAGAYSVPAEFKPSAPGSYQVCAWLDGGTTGSDPLAAPATVTVTARGPQVSQLTVVPPKLLRPNVGFTLSYTTQTDQQLSLLSAIVKVTKPGPSACAASFETQSQRAATVFGSGQQTVFGGPVTTSGDARLATGYYQVCTWVEGPTAGEVDGATTTPITVGTPVAAVSPKLRLTTVSASRNRGLSVAGTATTGFTGRLTVLAACGRSAAKGTATPRRGRFSTRLRVPGGCALGHRVRVTVSWAGSSSYTKQSTSKSVAVKR